LPETVGPFGSVGTDNPKGLGFAASLPDGFAAGEADADAEAAPEGGNLLSRVQGLGFDEATAEACSAGLVLVLGLQPASVAAMADAVSKKIERFIFGFLQICACTTSRKAFANRCEVCRAAALL